MELTSLFYFVDSFCVLVDAHQMTPRRPGPKPSLYPSEIITVLLAASAYRFRDFKTFYTKQALPHLRKDFPKLVSYSRFIELLPRVAFYLLALSRVLCAPCTGKSFVDSSLLRVCQPVRAPRHRVFRGLASWGKNTKGWVFGLKLHLVISEYRGIIAFALTSAKVDDRKPLPRLFEKVFGKVYADKGYLSQKWMEAFFQKGIELITRLKKGMKGALLKTEDARGLWERAKVETVLSQLKSYNEIEHTRHRSVPNALIHIVAVLISHNIFSRHSSLAPWAPGDSFDPSSF